MGSVGRRVSKINIWSSLAGLELLRLLRQQPYRLFRLSVMATVTTVVLIAYAWGGPKTSLRWQDIEGIAEWLLPIVCVALYLAVYFCFPLILSTALLERGAESPTMLLRLSRLSGRDILLVKMLAGIGAFVYACLPVAPVLGFAFAVNPSGLLFFFLFEAFLLWVMIHVGLIVLAFSVSAKRAADAYRRSLFAFVMLWFIPGASPGGIQFLVENFPIVPWQGWLAFNLWFSLYLPWLAFKRAGQQLDAPDDLVGMKVTPPEEVQASAPIEWAQWIFGKFLLIFAIGCTIPSMSIFAYFLQDVLNDGRLASWLFIQIPATILLMITLTLRLTFSSYFEPTGAMYSLLLAAPTSPAWWFGKLLLFRSKAVLGAMAFFGVAALLSLQVEAARGVLLLLLIVTEIVIATLWLFALTTGCRPRFLALPAILVYFAAVYLLPLAFPPHLGSMPWAALTIAVALSLITLRWPHPASIVAMAIAWAYARNLSLVAAQVPPAPTHHFSTMVFSFILSAGRGPGLPSIELDLPGFPSIEAVKAMLVGDLVVLAVVIVWLRWAFDAMVGRTAYRLFPRFMTRRRSDGDAGDQ
jgi:hypothetical protein